MFFLNGTSASTGLPRDFHRNSMGLPWDFHGITVLPYGTFVGIEWYSHGNSMGFPRDFHENPANALIFRWWRGDGTWTQTRKGRVDGREEYGACAASNVKEGARTAK